VRRGDRTTHPPAGAEYVRDVGEVIGWDDGREARVSFVECSGGDAAGRAFHGRPMHRDNEKLRRTAGGSAR